MDPCLIYAPLVAVLVSVLKSLPLVAKWPKTTALVIATATVAAEHFLPALQIGGALSGKQLALCVLAQWGVAVGTYEATLKPVGNLLGLDVAKIAAQARADNASGNTSVKSIH